MANPQLVNRTAEHKAALQDYFDGVGFDRWRAIYGGDDELSYIRRTVQEGHAQMLDTARDWLLDDGSHTRESDATLFDAGCGTGLFSLMMAQQGYTVRGVDIAPRMVQQAQSAAADAGLTQTHFTAGDIATVQDSFDVVACFDVLVHYPRQLFVELCTRLAQQATHTLILTYAPYRRLLALLHYIGGFFPKGQRRTEIQMIPDALVAQTLADAGMTIRRTQEISQGFYHVTLLEATRR